MKFMKLWVAVVALLISGTVMAAEKTDSIRVEGNCGMCKSRIEKAAKADGVQFAQWDSKTKMLIVKYNDKKTTNSKIQQRVANAGHDTEKYRAENTVYEKLPGCCLYDRKD